MNQYYPGALVTLEGDFFTAVQAPVAPSSVTLKYGPRNGSATTVSTGFTNPGTGVYQYNVNLTGYTEGVYDYWWESTGTAQASNVGSFYVAAAPF